MRLGAKRMMRRWCGVESAPYIYSILVARLAQNSEPLDRMSLDVRHCGEGDMGDNKYEVHDVM